MQNRKPGNSSLEVSALGLGCMGMNFSYTLFPDRQEMISLIKLLVQTHLVIVTSERQPSTIGMG